MDVVEGVGTRQYLVGERFGGHMARASERFNKRVRRLGFPKELVYHSLRHTFTGKLESAGVAQNIAELLLNLRKDSIGDEVSRFFEVLHDQPLAKAVTPSAFCQARKKLNPRAPMGLSRPLLEGFQSHFSPKSTGICYV